MKCETSQLSKLPSNVLSSYSSSSVSLKSPSSFTSLATTATIMTSIASASASSLGPSSQTSMVAAFLSNMPRQRRAMGPAFVTMFPPAPTVLKAASMDASSVSEDLPDISSEKSLKHKLGVNAVNYAVAHPLIVGHRGSPYLELENTREGFQRCADMGCDSAELDVFLLKCGTLVVFHGRGPDESPGDLKDYCGVEGSILDLTYEEAKTLKFNPEFDEFPCPTSTIQAGIIPTLEEVLLDAKETGLFIKIEMKGPNTVEPILELVERLDLVHQCSFASFNLERVALVRKLRPQKAATGEYVYNTGALFNILPDDFIEKAQKAGASEVHLKYDTCSADNVSKIHNAGMSSMAWFRGPAGMTSDSLEKYWDIGNEDEIMYATVLRTGVQAVCLNKPDVMIGLQRNRTQLMLEQHVYESDVAIAKPFFKSVQAAN